MKRPSLRVACIADVAPEVLDELEADLDQFAALLPFRVKSFEVVGSAARRAWQFHSDLDINLETGTEREWVEAKRLWRAHADRSRDALRFLRQLMDKWGMRLEASLEHPSVKAVQDKSCYDLRERRHYRPEKTLRVDIREGRTYPRLTAPPSRPPTFSWSFLNDEGEQIGNKEPYPADEVATWTRRYGTKFLRIGDTPDTAYLKR